MSDQRIFIGDAGDDPSMFVLMSRVRAVDALLWRDRQKAPPPSWASFRIDERELAGQVKPTSEIAARFGFKLEALQFRRGQVLASTAAKVEQFHRSYME